MNILKTTAWFAALALFLAAQLWGSQHDRPVTQDKFVLEPSLHLLLGPSRTTAEYHYVMTGRVRLLLFWRGADDVGGGYIRRSVSLSDPNIRLIQVLFG